MFAVRKLSADVQRRQSLQEKEEEEEQPSKKRRRLQRKQNTQPEPHVQLDPSEQLAEQTTSAEDTGNKKRQAHKPFTVDDINEEVYTEPLFHKCPGTSVLKVVSYFLPKHTLTNLALDTKIYYKDEKKQVLPSEEAEQRSGTDHTARGGLHEFRTCSQSCTSDRAPRFEWDAKARHRFDRAGSHHELSAKEYW